MIERARFREKETIVTIIAERRFIEVAKRDILSSRKELEAFIRDDPFFQLTYEPYPCPGDAPEIVRRMCDASMMADVGPMASVAGAIAELAVEAMVDAGAGHAIVDNGGDIALHIDRPVTVGIYTGGSKIKNLAFRLEPTCGNAGVCTSSGTVGPSVSLGNADAAVVFAGSASVADAFATALGNAIRKDEKGHVERAIKEFNMNGVDGVMVVTRNHLATRGRLPEIMRSEVNCDLITKG
jgi:ApbE superfamily uncharacterized protein (UPF0280 family)